MYTKTYKYSIDISMFVLKHFHVTL